MPIDSKFRLLLNLSVLFDGPICFWATLLVDKRLHAYLCELCLSFLASRINLL